MPRKRHVQRRRIFIGCEGDGERGYITFIANTLEHVHSRIYIDAKLLRPGGGDPLALVQVAQTIIQREERNREPYERKFLIIDNDKIGISQNRDQQAYALAARIGASFIWQITAHEALLLRHLPGCAMRRPPSTATAEQQLRREWPEYAKPMSAAAIGRTLDIESLRQANGVEPELAVFLSEIGLFPA
ncbi:MAG: hypothetical protein EOO23_04705 [Comamonadaceae bacterium]|nr:MAG: hypothetical protein EOO23_04705 [Comamonadaceae bacterium]